MNKYGFYLKKLRLIGEKVKNAEVEFSTGLNVIYGPSDTGKTYIYQCIDYMLGSRHTPKKIPEAKDYQSCFLEISSYDNKSFTLERSLSGGDFYLYENSLDNLNTAKKLITRNDLNSSKESVSDFLLKLCNIENKKIRKNLNGETQNLYFQDIHKYFMIDEEEVIVQSSPIAKKPKRGANIHRTFEENVFKFLLTGQDDSSIIALLTKNDITNKKGKLELLEELIEQIKSQFTELPNIEAINLQISKLDKKIDSIQEDFGIAQNTFNQYENRKNNIYEMMIKKESRINTLNEILNRSKLLAMQYENDIDRLKATIEASQLMDISNCPVCGSELENVSKIDFEKIICASEKEIFKIKLLYDELEESVKLFKDERVLLNEELVTIKSDYNKILDIIKNEVNHKLTEVSEMLKIFLGKRSHLVKTQALMKEFSKYEEQKATIDRVISDNKENAQKTDYEKLSVSLLSNFTQIMHTILKEIKFDNIGDNVGFSEDFLDFVIAGKNRGAFGKGYRAILYGVFIVANLIYLKDKSYKVGFSIIDSPLNPYKPGEEKNDSVTTDLAINFYTYLYNHVKEQQVIIIENTAVPEPIEDDIRYIKFSKENGFIPKQNRMKPDLLK